MRISIITVCLNSEKTIEQTIQSVLSQDYDDLEYIIVDGKSTDRTLEIIDKYKESISTVISEADTGIYDAMNKGISLATGEIIGIINSDDWYEKKIFKYIRNYFSESNADVIYGRMNLIDENGNVKVLIPTDIKKIRYEMEIPHSTVFVKKNIYEKYGAFSLKYQIASDYEMILRFYIKGVRFAYLDKVLANFRLGGISCRKARLCTLETLAISRNNLKFTPLKERPYLENIITHRERAFIFGNVLNDYPEMFSDYVKELLNGKSEKELVLFGAGKWGMKAYQILACRGIAPLFLVDNNQSIQNTDKDEIQIFSPEILNSFKGVLMILVKDFSEDILLQITKLNNPKIFCIRWEEIADEFEKIIDM